MQISRVLVLYKFYMQDEILYFTRLSSDIEFIPAIQSITRHPEKYCHMRYTPRGS